MFDELNPNKKTYGFVIEDWRKHLWSIELKLAKYLDSVCKENNLDYFLIGGGAIGAIRDQGFIPWDDDLDFGMYRKDFDKLLILLKEKPVSNVSVQYGATGDFCSFLLRIRDDNSTGIVLAEKDYLNESQGVFIEVYPFDNVPNSFLKLKKQKLVSKYYTRVIHAKMFKKEKTFLSILLRSLYFRVSSSVLWKKLLKNSTKYDSIDTKFVDTPSLSHYFSLGIHHFKKEWIASTQYVQFEKISLPVCLGNDECLKLQYGDYMKLPLVSERGMVHNQTIFYDVYHSYKSKL